MFLLSRSHDPSLLRSKRREEIFSRLYVTEWHKFRSLKWAFGFIFLFCLLVVVLGKTTSKSASSEDIPEPSEYRIEDYRSPVPKTLRGAHVISAFEAEKLLSTRSALFIDVNPRPPRPALLPAGTVWRDVPHSSIEGAYWLPNVGYGLLSTEVENYFKTRLQSLTLNNKNRSLVFFCLKECWMSWNAAKRALSWGYNSVNWFPDGTDGWQMQGNSLVPIDPVP